jgi:hypothetical protein
MGSGTTWSSQVLEDIKKMKEFLENERVGYLRRKKR